MADADPRGRAADRDLHLAARASPEERRHAVPPRRHRRRRSLDGLRQTRARSDGFLAAHIMTCECKFPLLKVEHVSCLPGYDAGGNTMHSPKQQKHDLLFYIGMNAVIALIIGVSVWFAWPFA